MNLKIGKMSSKKRKMEAGDHLFKLEEKRVEAETASFHAQETYWKEKTRREEELHSIVMKMRKRKLHDLES